MEKAHFEKLKVLITAKEISKIQISILKPDGKYYTKSYIRMVIAGKRMNYKILGKAIDILEKKREREKWMESRLENL